MFYHLWIKWQVSVNYILVCTYVEVQSFLWGCFQLSWMVRVEETYGGPPFLTTEHRCGPQREATLHPVTFHYNIKQIKQIQSSTEIFIFRIMFNYISAILFPNWLNTLFVIHFFITIFLIKQNNLLTVENSGFCPISDRLLHWTMENISPFAVLKRKFH